MSHSFLHLYNSYVYQANPIILHPHHSQVQRRNGRKLTPRGYQILQFSFLWPLDLQMVTTEVWLENKLTGLPKNIGVITHCLKVLWKRLTRPNYYDITVIYINTFFSANLLQVLQVACYASHLASQVEVFGCSLSYEDITTKAPKMVTLHTCENQAFLTYKFSHCISFEKWLTELLTVSQTILKSLYQVIVVQNTNKCLKIKLFTWLIMFHT